MDVFGGINLILVQGGIFGVQKRKFFTKNVKEKEVFLNNRSEGERCIHDESSEEGSVWRQRIDQPSQFRMKRLEGSILNPR